METTTTIVESISSNEVAKYTDLINTYGASTVIIAVFLIVLVCMFMYILRTNQKTNNQLIKQQQELVSRLLEKEDKKDNEEDKEEHSKIKTEPDIVEMFLKINAGLKDTLKDIQDEINADKVAVYVFHNGVYSSHGLPFFKTSCVCDVVKKNCGVGKSITHSNLPLQMFDNNISHLYKHGYMSVCDVDNDEDDIVKDAPILIGMFKNNNIKSVSGVSIYDHDNNMVGILIGEFTEVHDEEFLKDVENKLIANAPLLSPILEYSGIYDNNDTTK